MRLRFGAPWRGSGYQTGFEAQRSGWWNRYRLVRAWRDPRVTRPAQLARLARGLPGLLVVANLADLKRRNGHLGHAAGDEEMRAFALLLAALRRHPGALVYGVDGGNWAAVIGADAAGELAARVAAFGTASAAVVGWRGTVVLPDGTAATAEDVRPRLVRRGVRCVHRRVATRAGLETALPELCAAVRHAPVGVPLARPPGAPLPTRTPWRCVDGVPKDLRCPACGGTAFAWDGGAEDAAEGTCAGCGGAVDFWFF